jgi:hypothetical protein
MRGPHLKRDICRQTLGDPIAWKGVTKGWRKVVRPRPPALTMSKPSRFCTRNGRFRIFSSHHLNQGQKGLASPPPKTVFSANRPILVISQFGSAIPVPKPMAELRWCGNPCGNFVSRVLTGLPAKLARDWVASGGRQVVDDTWSWAAPSSRKELIRTNSDGTRPAIIRFCKERLALLVPIAVG